MNAEVRKVEVLLGAKGAHRGLPHDTECLFIPDSYEAIPMFLRQTRRDLADVLSLVSPFGDLFLMPKVLLIPGPDALGKTIDLGSSIVVIVLPAHGPSRPVQ